MEKHSLIRKNRQVFLLYSGFFIFLATVVFSYFYLNDKTFIHGDGWYQHYTSLLYYSEYLKKIFRTIFVDHIFSIPTWDFAIGEGEDIITAMHYYCVGDPIAFLSVLIPRNKMYLFYDFSSVFRMYLSGFSFIYLCLYTGNDNKNAVLAGALAYTFCYWNLLNTSKHIFFLNPMIYFPLFITGIEKVLNNDNKLFLSFAVCLGALSNFYFFYMMVILTVIYVAVRLLIMYKIDFRAMISKVIDIFFHAVVGVLLAAVILFPIINTMLSSGRLNVEYGFHFLYPRFYYERLMTMFLTCDNDRWLVMGFVSPVVLSTLLAFRQPRKDPLIFALHIIALAGVCIPFFGKMLNGFAYVANRWSFSLSLLSAYTLAKKWTEFEKNRRYLIISVVVFALFSFVTAWWRMEKVLPTIIYLSFLFVSVTSMKVFSERPELREKIMILLIVLSILVTSDYAFSERGKNRINGAKSEQEAKELISSKEASLFKQYISQHGDEGGFYRYSGNELTTNAAMLSSVYSTNYYFSLSNPYVGGYRSSLGLNEYFLNWYNEYDKRAPLYSLANVRYYLDFGKGLSEIPYGFVYQDSFSDYDLYRNAEELPFGYTYDDSVSYDYWNDLSQAEKEETLLQYAVLEEGPDDRSPVWFGTNIHGRILPEENTEVSGNVIETAEDKASVIFEFSGEADKIYYFCIEGISYDDHEDYYSGDPITDVSIKLKYNDVEKEILYHTEDYQFYNGRDSFVCCLGQQEREINEIEIRFSKKGTYTIKDVYVRCIDKERYAGFIEDRKGSHMENVVVSDASVSGTIDLKEEKILLLSIPYSKGWKATVDGEKAELLRANDCYMALKLDQGHHEIRLHYHTPYLFPGLITSVSTALAIFLYSFIKKKRSKK